MPEPLSTEPKARHDPYAAFRVPALRNYLIAGTLVRLGTGGQALAISFEVYDRTDSYLALAWVALMQAIPMLLLTLPSGVLADRYDRRKLMLLGMAGTSLTSIGLGLFSAAQGSIGLMYALLFVDACFLRLTWPARAALLPMLAPRAIFESAVKWRSSLGQLSGLGGPAIGGLIIAWYLPAAYFVSAASTVAFMIVLTTLRVNAKPEPSDSAKGMAGVVADVREGLAFVWRQKLVLAAISLDLFAVLLGGATYLLPVFAKDILGVDERGLGLLASAPAAGAVVTAMILAYLPPMKRAGLTLLLAVAGFGMATIVFGLSTNFWLSLAMLFLTGVFDNVSVVVRHTLVQLATPDAMRGRVSAVSSMFISSSNELGGVESGLVAAWTTPVFSVVSGGVGTLVIVLAWAGLFPDLRRLQRLDQVG
jgi:MFS family permease